jgi:LPS sulfotransferase NodH
MNSVNERATVHPFLTAHATHRARREHDHREPTLAAEFENFVFILAAQRTGTNLLRTMLGSHPEIDGDPGEIFDRDFAAVPAFPRFFDYLIAQVNERPAACLPSSRTTLIDAYLRMLRSRSTKRLLVLDIKYNSIHHFNSDWEEPVVDITTYHSVSAFKYAHDRGIKIIHLKRESVFDEVISTIVADRTGIYHLWSDDNKRPEGIKFRVDVEGLKFRMAQRLQTKKLFDRILVDYPRLLEIKYERILEYGEFSKMQTAKLASFLGVSDEFSRTPVTRKVLDNWRDLVLNVREVEAAIRGI